MTGSTAVFIDAEALLAGSKIVQLALGDWQHDARWEAQLREAVVAQLRLPQRWQQDGAFRLQYFDSDFPYSSVVEEGAAAVRNHGEFLPLARSEELETQAAMRWDLFYRRHAAGFFKPRNYLLHCFPELAVSDEFNAERKSVAMSAVPSCDREKDRSSAQVEKRGRPVRLPLAE